MSSNDVIDLTEETSCAPEQPAVPPSSSSGPIGVDLSADLVDLTQDGEASTHPENSTSLMAPQHFEQFLAEERASLSAVQSLSQVPGSRTAAAPSFRPRRPSQIRKPPQTGKEPSAASVSRPEQERQANKKASQNGKFAKRQPDAASKKRSRKDHHPPGQDSRKKQRIKQKNTPGPNSNSLTAAGQSSKNNAHQKNGGKRQREGNDANQPEDKRPFNGSVPEGSACKKKKKKRRKKKKKNLHQGKNNSNLMETAQQSQSQTPPTTDTQTNAERKMQSKDKQLVRGAGSQSGNRQRKKNRRPKKRGNGAANRPQDQAQRSLSAERESRRTTADETPLKNEENEKVHGVQAPLKTTGLDCDRVSDASEPESTSTKDMGVSSLNERVGIGDMLLSQTQTQKEVSDNTNSPSIRGEPEDETGGAAADTAVPEPINISQQKLSIDDNTEEQGRQTQVLKKRPVEPLLRRAPKQQLRVQFLEEKNWLRALIEQSTVAHETASTSPDKTCKLNPESGALSKTDPNKVGDKSNLPLDESCKLPAKKSDSPSNLDLDKVEVIKEPSSEHCELQPANRHMTLKVYPNKVEELGQHSSVSTESEGTTLFPEKSVESHTKKVVQARSNQGEAEQDTEHDAMIAGAKGHDDNTTAMSSQSEPQDTVKLRDMRVFWDSTFAPCTGDTRSDNVHAKIPFASSEKEIRPEPEVSKNTMPLKDSEIKKHQQESLAIESTLNKIDKKESSHKNAPHSRDTFVTEESSKSRPASHTPNSAPTEPINDKEQKEERQQQLQRKKEDGKREKLHKALKDMASLEEIQRLAESNPGILQETDKHLNTPLHLACYYEASWEVVKLLVDHYPGALEMKTEDGWTPLHLACGNNAPLEVFLLLVDRFPGALEMNTDDAWTPLHLACGNNAPLEVILLLVGRFPGAIEMKTKDGRTPLHLACRDNAPLAVVQLLVDRIPGALEMKDKNGNTPLDYCDADTKAKILESKRITPINDQKDSPAMSTGKPKPASGSEPHIIDLVSNENIDKQRSHIGQKKATFTTSKSWQSTVIIIDSSDEEENLGSQAPVRARRRSNQDTRTAKTSGLGTREEMSRTAPSRTGTAPKCWNRCHMDTHFNFDVSTEDAKREQERLFAEAATRVRRQGLRPGPFTVQGAPTFTRPVTDLSKLNKDHWRWPCPFARLGLPRNASLVVIKRQYRRLALAYHPDKSKEKDTATRFQAVTEAYHIVSRRARTL